MLIDENKMSQVLMNIMLNAIYTMDGGGELIIKTHLGNETLVITIKDNGKGISPDVMPNVFDPFFTTKGIGEGTGLGLSVSKGIVEQHDGSIEVESQVGVGTKFRIQLPISNIS